MPPELFSVIRFSPGPSAREGGVLNLASAQDCPGVARVFTGENEAVFLRF